MKKRAMKEGKQYARLAAYAAAAGAALASAGTAEAGIVYSGLTYSATSAPGTTITGTSFKARVMTSTGMHWKAGMISGNNSLQINLDQSFNARILAATQSVNVTANFKPFGLLFNVGSGTNSTSVGQFRKSTGGYIGIKFNGGSGVKYGWMHIAQVDPAVPSFSIDRWAYEDSGIVINAGQIMSAPATVPEPTSCARALIALGAGGLAVHRRRRQELEALQDQAA